MPFNDTRIRPAAPGEHAACRALLPEVFPSLGRVPELWVAAAAEGVAGVAAVAFVPRGFPVFVRVAAPWRRRGIGRALLDAIAEFCRGETALLRGWSPVDDGGHAACFMAACGFAVTRRVLVFETDAERFAAAMTVLRSRMAAGGRIPAGAAVVTLAGADAGAVIRLVAPALDMTAHDVALRVRPGGAAAFDPELSLVLLLDGMVVGAILGRLEGSTAHIDVHAVAPQFRGGWANLVLLAQMATRGRAMGVTLFRFTCEEHVRDTINLARRSQARALTPQVMMARRVPGIGIHEGRLL